MKLPRLDLSSWFLPRTAWIQVEVTTRCNAACIYCPRTAYGDAWQDRFLPLEAFRHLLPALRKTRLVHLQGWGEPFLHPDFFRIAALAREAGCRVSTTTNGMLLDEAKLRQLIASGIDIVAFSLAGSETGHNRSRPGTSFRKVIAGIQTLNRLKAEAGAVIPQVHVAYMLLRSGLSELDSLPQVLEGLGVNQVVISTLDFVPTRELADESLLGATRPEYEELHDRLEGVTTAAARSGVAVHYHLTDPGVRGLLCPDNPQGALVMAADGSVSPCVFTNLPVTGVTYLGRGAELPYHRLVFGNLLKEDLGVIWRQPAYANFRRTFFTGRIAESCRQCLRL
jgi:MoaA/NifB/PqqE/SkfB family radical SAM enzyme